MRLLRALWLLCWSVFATSVIVAAVALSLIRLLLPMAQNYREDIAAWISSAVGHEVHIAGLDARWSGVRPVLQLRGVTIASMQTGLIEIDTVDVSLGIAASQHTWRLVPSRLSIVHPRITLFAHSASQPFEHPFAGFAGFAGWPLGASRVRVEDARVCVDTRELRGCFTGNASLRSDGNRLMGEADLRLSAPWGKTVHFALDAYTNDNVWAGAWYLETKGLHLAPWIHRWYPTVVVDGFLNLRVWGNLALTQCEGVIDRLLIQADDTSEGSRTLAEMVDGFSWKKETAGWQVDIAGLRPLGTPGGATVQVQRDVQNLWVRAGNISLKEVAFLASLDGVLEGKTATLMRALSPQGQLAELRLHLPLAESSVEHPADNPSENPTAGLSLSTWKNVDLQTRFTDVSVRPWQGIPGIEALSGSLRIVNGTGSLDFEDLHGTLYLASLFATPWAIDRLTGSLTVQQDSLGWHLTAPNLVLANPDLALKAGGRLFLPSTGLSPGLLGIGLSPRLDIEASFSRGDGSRLSTYLPRRIMPYRAAAWLDRSILAGKIREGTVHFHGHVADFPFDHNEGTFVVNAQITGGEVSYAPDWPALHALDVTLGFHGRAMEIQAEGGRILDSALDPTSVVISDLDHEPPLLQIRGRVHGPLADVPRLLKETPLVHRYGPYVATLEGKGKMSLTLGVDMYTKKPIEMSRLEGHLDLQKNDLRWHDPDVALEGTSGSLAFSTEGIHGQQIETHLFGLPVQLSVQSQRAAGGHSTTVMEVRGTLEPNTLKTYLPPALLKRCRGQTSWQATITLPEIPPGGKAMPVVQVASDLRGLALDLPEPLAKSAEQPQPLQLQTALGGNQHKIQISYGTLASATLELDKDSTFLQGDVRLGKATTTPPKISMPRPAGLYLAADLTKTRLEDWLDLASGLGGTTDSHRTALGFGMDAKIGDLRVGSYDFHGVALSAGSQGEGWEAHFNAQETTGRLHGSGAGGMGLTLELDRLTLVDNVEKHTKKDTPEETSTDPRHLPPFQIRCADLHLASVIQQEQGKEKTTKTEDMPLGRLEITTRPDPEGMTITGLHLHAPTFQIDGTGSWHTQRSDHLHEGGQHSSFDLTSFDLSLDTPNLGNALNTLGYAGTLEGGVGKASLHTEWPGAPSAFAVEPMMGTLAITLDKGRLVHVNPGSTGRIFGLLSLQALPRRLAFDFSDVFRKGLSFDRMHGDFRIDHGNAYSDNLELRGPAANIAVEGRTGLIARDYDQVVTVTPNVGGTLPLAGALAAGSVGLGFGVGAAIVLAQQLFQSQPLQPLRHLIPFGLDQITNIRYTLRGSWYHPVMEPLRVEASEKKNHTNP